MSARCAGGAGAAYLESRSAHEEAFRALGVVEATVADGHGRGAHGEPADVELAAAAVAELGCFVDQLQR